MGTCDKKVTFWNSVFLFLLLNCRKTFFCVKIQFLCPSCIMLKRVNLTSLFNRLEFVLENGNLKHTKSGKCVQPIGAASDGVGLGLYSSCGGHQFSFTAGGSLQHVGSKKCVNTKSGVSIVKYVAKKNFWNNIVLFYYKVLVKRTGK